MKSILLCATLVIGASVVGGRLFAVSAPGQEVKPPATQPSTQPAKLDDPAEVRRSMKLMRIWMLTQDYAPLDEYVYGQDEQGRKFIDSASYYTRAIHDLIEPVRSRFGEKSVEQTGLGFPPLDEAVARIKKMGDPSYDLIDAAPVSIKGDVASVGPEGQTIELRRLGGHWKLPLNLEVFLAANGWDAAKLKEVTGCYNQTAKDLVGLRKDIEAGKFKTADEALAARKQIENRIYPNR